MRSPCSARCVTLLASLTVLCFGPLHGQDSESSARLLTSPSDQIGQLNCPGTFPTDLTLTSCQFTNQQRLQQWVTSSFTDQAMLGAVGFGAFAQAFKSPGEWGRTWGGYGDRIGVRYTQAAARGTAEALVGVMMHDDPRHLSYKNDPHTHWGVKTSCGGFGIRSTSYGTPPLSAWTRIGHAFRDSVTVLENSPCGNGKRRFAFDRLAGIGADAYGGYAWYPRAENTLPNAADRAAMSYGSTVLTSFYTEFSPEISLGLAKIFARKKVPASSPMAQSLALKKGKR